MLQVRDATVSIKRKRIVSQVSFSLEAGQVGVLIGPNGGGKTTLLRAISGVLPTECGEIAARGANVDKLKPRELARLIAYVPQEELWTFPFSALQIVAMGRLVHGDRFSETEEDVNLSRSTLEAVDALHLANQNAMTLSGGERQRVLIARALVQETPILLFDEPTAHLDPKHTNLIVSLLRRLKESGRTILCSLHDLNVAAQVSDLVIYVNEGTADAHSPEEGLHPSNLRKLFSTEFVQVQVDGCTHVIQQHGLTSSTQKTTIDSP